MTRNEADYKAKSRDIVKLTYKALDDKKAEDIRIIDISDVSTIADYFIIANGTNRNQVRALVDNVEEILYKAGYTDCRKEGYSGSSWVLLDYSDVIIHIFDTTSRKYYDLERIWNDGRKIGIRDIEE